MKIFKYFLIMIFLLFFSGIVVAEDGIYITLETGWGIQSGLPSQSASGANKIVTTYFLSAYRGGVGYIHDFFPVFGIGVDVGFGRYGDVIYYFSGSPSIKLYSTTVEYMFDMIFHIRKFDLLTKIGGVRQSMFFGNVETKTKQHLKFDVTLFYNITKHFAVSCGYGYSFGGQITSVTGPSYPKTSSLNDVLIGFRITF